MISAPSAPSTPDGRLPSYSRHLWTFGFLNAVNFTIALGAPMVLCARYLGARESLIGFLLALTPLFTVLQLPAARFADRIGYQKLMMLGWRARAFMVIGMVPLPMLKGVLPASLLLFLLTALAIAFNVIRGYASGSWFPWLKQLIPAPTLGRYISIESIVTNVAALLTLLLSAWILGQSPVGWHYSLLLALSGTAGVISVFPLGKAPESRPVAAGEKPHERTWTIVRRVWQNDKYRRLIRYTMMNSFALGSTSGFMILYFKELVGLSEGAVVGLTTLGMVGAVTGAYLLGHYIDRVGSRPVMRVAGLGHLVFFLFWVADAVVRPSWMPALTLPVIALGGIIGNAVGVATGRLILNTCPREDLTVAMALSQVGLAFSSGVGTLIWGFLLEWFRAPEFYGPASCWPFVIFFGVTATFLGAAQLMLRHVEEEQAFKTDRFIRALLIEWPQQVWGDLRRRDDDK